MKKDENIERLFDEYFDGLEKPDGLAEDAKQLNIKRKPKRTVIFKYASAVSCALVVCVAASIGIYSGLNGAKGFSANENDYYSYPGNSGDPSGETYYGVYSLDGLETGALDPDEIADENGALTYIYRVANADGARITGCTGYYDGGELYLVKAEIAVESQNLNAVIYAELTDGGYICDIFTNYYDEGEYIEYNGAGYLFYETEDGAKCFSAKLDGIRYYAQITCADETAYLNYLYLLLG